MTSEEAKAAGLVQVTEPAYPGSVVKTARGDVEYGEWLRGEARRVEAAGRRTVVVQDGRLAALFASPASPAKLRAVPTGGRRTVT